MINSQKQKGMVLIIVMLILPLLLVLATLLMEGSFLGLRIIDSRVMKGESNMILEGAAVDILNAPDSPGKFAAATKSDNPTEAPDPEDSSQFESTLFDDVSTTVQVDGDGLSNCKRSMQASGTNNNFKCKYVQVNLFHSYGRETASGAKWAMNTMGQGVEQPILTD